MFGGEGAYVPHPSSAVDLKLRLHEIINVFDISLVAHPARALLDSGALQRLQLRPCRCNSHTLCDPIRQRIVKGLLGNKTFLCKSKKVSCELLRCSQCLQAQPLQWLYLIDGFHGKGRMLICAVGACGREWGPHPDHAPLCCTAAAGGRQREAQAGSCQADHCGWCGGGGFGADPSHESQLRAAWYASVHLVTSQGSSVSPDAGLHPSETLLHVLTMLVACALTVP